VITREPGGTPFGEIVRGILLDPEGPDRSSLAEVFLYSAARSELVEKVIKPALDQGKIVISERYTDSTWVYQGYAGGVPISYIETISQVATGGLSPDATFVLDVTDPRVIQGRTALKRKDKIESRPETFHERVREGYRRLSDRFPDRIKLIDGSLPPSQVEELIWSQVQILLSNRGYEIEDSRPGGGDSGEAYNCGGAR